jgi:probable F420-dependent oxidoreductase
MKFGVMLPVQGPVANSQAIIGTAKEAERLGYASVWVHDGYATRQTNHNFSVCGAIEYNKQDSDPVFFEPLSTLSCIAGATRTIRLGCCTIILPLYDPVQVAKQSAAIDNLSSGRLILGVAIGGAPTLGKLLKIRGLDFEQRGKIFDDYVRAIRALWTEPSSSFQGNYVKFSDVEMYPKPLNNKIYIGASIRPRGIRRLAELADGWLPSHTLSPVQISTAVNQIKEKAKKYGRNDLQLDVIHRTYACIGKTSQEAMDISKKTLGVREGAAAEGMSMLVGTKDQVIGKVKEFQNAGVSHLGIYPIFRGNNLDDLYRMIQGFAEDIFPNFDSG